LSNLQAVGSRLGLVGKLDQDEICAVVNVNDTDGEVDLAINCGQEISLHAEEVPPSLVIPEHSDCF
jgi:hypothetical protein